MLTCRWVKQGDLTDLFNIELGNNHLHGPLPDTMRKLTNLTTISFGGDKAANHNFGLSGPLPGWLGELTELNAVNLAINKFSG